jgi:hypothetical protein
MTLNFAITFIRAAASKAIKQNMRNTHTQVRTHVLVACPNLQQTWAKPMRMTDCFTVNHKGSCQQGH